MNKIQKILIFVIVVFSILFLTQIFVYQYLLKEQSNMETTTIDNKRKLVDEIYKEADLTLTKDGYKITYLETTDDILITVTKNPFIKNKKAATLFIESFGIDCSILNPIILAEKGLELTTEEEGTMGDCNGE